MECDIVLISLVKQGQLYFIFSFLALIGLGTLALKVPFCYHAEPPLAWLDALFTATSAVCVTGLATVPLSNFTFAGQLVVLLLIQLGGIGIMTLTASIILWLGRGMSFGNTMMMSNLSDNFSVRNTEGLLKTVMSYTFSIEAAGALLLLAGFLLDGRYGFLESCYYGIFHAVSAFCNAGFSPFDESLIGASPMVKLTVSALIVAGGIGIYVIYDLSHKRRQLGMLKIHTRLVLITSAVLIVLGTLGLRWFETLSDHPTIPWIDALFQSVSARTAGFNSVNIGELSQNSNSLLMILMMIGASPGSTGGGMKTTVAALAVLAIVNTFLGNRRVLLFRREISIDNILKSFTIIVTFVLLVVLGATVLSPMIESSVQAVLFEATSALSTTGLSMGLTAGLPPPAKLLLIVYMFIGRIGPFTMFLFLLGREKVSRVSYPEERIIIG